MKKLRRIALVALICLVPGTGSSPTVGAANPPVLGVMQAELDRNFQVLSKEPSPAYFISYTVHDERTTYLSASFGALEQSDENRGRSATVEVRVGEYFLDNTHPIRGDVSAMSPRLRRIALPLADDEEPIRQALWLGTDRAFKQAAQALTRVKIVGSLGLSAQQPGKPSVAPAGTNAWPQFRGNAQLTGVVPSELSVPLKVLWTYEAGDAIDSSAAIADGTVFVGSGSGELTALDLQTGAVRWKYQTGSQIAESSPAVANGAVYVGDLAGLFHAVDVKTGKALWTFKTGSEIRSSPVVAGDKVLIGSYDQYLYGLSVRDGALAWKVEFQGYVHATPAILNGVAYLAGCDETLRGIRVSDGREIFNAPIGAYMGASPALVGNAAYVGTFNNEVLGVDLQSRKVMWRYRHPERQFPYYSSAAVAQGRVVLGGRDRMVHALDAKTGKAAWTFMTNARIDSSPVIAGNRVFIASNDDRLYVLDLMTGAKQWEFDAGAGFSASPAIAAGRLVIGAQDGRLYCFGA